MSDTKVFSLADLKSKQTNDTKYNTIDAYGGKLRIGSLCSADMIEWLEGNETPEKKRIGGIRLIVKSIVDEEGNRVPESEFEEYVAAFSQKNARSNGAVVNEVLKLNGFSVKPDPNASGEAPTVASPSGSQVH